MFDNAPPTVTLDGVSVRYPSGALAVEGIQLEIEAGEMVALLGPSGVGKTALLRLISGLDQPTTGTIQIDGQLPGDYREGLTYIFQDATLLPWKNVRHNIEEPLRLRGLDRPARRIIVEEMLQIVRLNGVHRRFPHELSGGMKMRVSVARALATKPSLLLLDEPFGALDAITRHTLNEELIKLRQRSKWTGVFVTHSVEEAVFLADRVILLEGEPGRIVSAQSIQLSAPRDARLREHPSYRGQVSALYAMLRSGTP